MSHFQPWGLLNSGLETEKIKAVLDGRDHLLFSGDWYKLEKVTSRLTEVKPVIQKAF